MSSYRAYTAPGSLVKRDHPACANRGHGALRDPVSPRAGGRPQAKRLDALRLPMDQCPPPSQLQAQRGDSARILPVNMQRALSSMNPMLAPPRAAFPGGTVLLAISLIFACRHAAVNAWACPIEPNDGTIVLGTGGTEALWLHFPGSPHHRAERGAPTRSRRTAPVVCVLSYGISSESERASASTTPGSMHHRPPSMRCITRWSSVFFWPGG